MSALDVAKAKIAYLKLWLGIMAATDISLVGWFVSHYRPASISIVALAAAAIVVVSTVLYFLHRRISAKIDELEEL